MNDLSVFVLLFTLIKNAMVCIPFVLLVGLAGGILSMTNPNSFVKNTSFYDAFLHSSSRCWPMIVFCAIVPMTLKCMAWLGIANIAIIMLIWVQNDVTKSRWYFEMSFTAQFLIVIGTMIASCYIIDEMKIKTTIDHVEQPKLLFLNLIIILIKNAMNAIFIVFSLCCSFLISYFTNPEQTEYIRHNIFKHQRDYHWYHAFSFGLYFENISIFSAIFCSIFPIAWEIVAFVSIVIVFIPIVLHVATCECEFYCIPKLFEKYDSRNHLEGHLCFWFNVTCASIYLFRMLQ